MNLLLYQLDAAVLRASIFGAIRGRQRQRADPRCEQRFSASGLALLQPQRPMSRRSRSEAWRSGGGGLRVHPAASSKKLPGECYRFLYSLPMSVDPTSCKLSLGRFIILLPTVTAMSQPVRRLPSIKQLPCPGSRNSRSARLPLQRSNWVMRP
jgi:hypothetical protein